MKLHNATDRIEKEIVLRAPQSRVWRALATAEEFGAWFGMKLEGDFAPGGRVHGQITHSGGAACSSAADERRGLGRAAREHRAICRGIAAARARLPARRRYLRRSVMKPGSRWSLD